MALCGLAQRHDITIDTNGTGMIEGLCRSRNSAWRRVPRHADTCLLCFVTRTPRSRPPSKALPSRLYQPTSPPTAQITHTPPTYHTPHTPHPSPLSPAPLPAHTCASGNDRWSLTEVADSVQPVTHDKRSSLLLHLRSLPHLSLIGVVTSLLPLRLIRLLLRRCRHRHPSDLMALQLATHPVRRLDRTATRQSFVS